MKVKLLTIVILLGMASGGAYAAPRPIVVELFTSQACSSCPPADALLKRVQAENPDVLALDLHVTYWDSFSWSDPYALQSATDRQNFYAALRSSSEDYTPEAVVDGQNQFVGSDSDMMAAAIDQARAKIAGGGAVPVAITAEPDSVYVSVGAGRNRGRIWLFGFDPEHTTRVLGGENGGATLSEVNVVRSITPLGIWNGHAMVLNVRPPAGKKFAALVQGADGEMLAAGSN